MFFIASPEESEERRPGGIMNGNGIEEYRLPDKFTIDSSILLSAARDSIALVTVSW